MLTHVPFDRSIGAMWPAWIFPSDIFAETSVDQVFFLVSVAFGAFSARPKGRGKKGAAGSPSSDETFMESADALAPHFPMHREIYSFSGESVLFWVLDRLKSKPWKAMEFPPKSPWFGGMATSASRRL